MELRGGNEEDGDMVAQLDARGGADGGENGAGQECWCKGRNWIRAWWYGWTGKEEE